MTLLFAGRLFAGPVVRESLKVKTQAPLSAEATNYRVPKDYNPDQREASRILVFFGGRNSTGSFLGSGALGFVEWADRLGIFLLATSFKDDTYWEPKEWSGKAPFDAIAEIKKKYRVSPSSLLPNSLSSRPTPKRCSSSVSGKSGMTFRESAIIR